MSEKHSFFPFQPELFDAINDVLFVKTSKPRQHRQNRKTTTSAQDTHRNIELDGKTLTYTLRRSNRRTFGFQIDESGLRITAPKNSPIYAIENAIRVKQKWILDKLDYYLYRRPPKTAPLRWQHGTPFPYLGKELTLHLEEQETRFPTFKLEENCLIACISLHHYEALERYIKNWLKKQAFDFLSKRLRYYAEQMNLTYDTFRISSARTRWGSCSAKRNIRLNWRLIHCELSLIDYVIVHELAHLSEMNHSPRFWSIVKQWYPDAINARKTLRNQSQQIFNLFAD